ncbi:MAG: hypothetical protein U0930_22340, partial [Pirellulales bacterium]
MRTTSIFSPQSEDLVNPLATRYVAPGKLPWIDVGTVDLSHLASRFASLRRAQIVGVHGSGKSTLLENLVPKLGSVVLRQGASSQTKFESSNPADSYPNSSAICWFSVRRGAAVMDSLMQFITTKKFCGTLVIDGFEQLNWWQRWQIKRWVGRCECKLLVTAHRNLGLPLLFQTSISEDLARRVIRQAFLAARGTADLPEPLERLPWEQLLKKHRGNLRECLMEVYDLIETLNREA